MDFKTAKEDLEKSIKEIDIALIKLDCLYTYVYGIKNRIRFFLSSKLRETLKIRFTQLEFIQDVLDLASNLNAEQRTFLVLGTIQYVQGRWSKFPSTGPLYELTLKRDELEQALSINAKEINLNKLMTQPKLIKETADLRFAAFFGKHPELKKTKVIKIT